jgi:hypothetical protein
VNYGPLAGVSTDVSPYGAARLAQTSLTDAPCSPIVFDDESAMTEPCFDAEPAPSWEAAWLPGVALAWVVAAGAVTAVELVTVGRVAPVVVAVDAIAAFLLPFALLWLVVSFVAPGDQPPRDEEDDKRGLLG